jgi:Cellulose biosynthesis protein BcsS
VQGHKLGLKLQAESWFDYSPRTFFSLDASYGTAFQEYWTLARAGYRVTPRLSLGIEGGALGNEEYDAGRGGAFTRIYFRNTEITVSGGTISRTTRAVMCRSESIGRSEKVRAARAAALT